MEMQIVKKDRSYAMLLDQDTYERIKDRVVCLDRQPQKNGEYVRAFLLEKIDGRRVHHPISHIALGIPVGIEILIDHINRNPLDNRRENLRVVTKLQNSRNRAGSSKQGFKGVFKTRENCTRYGAQIRVNGDRIHLGWFNKPESAAIAYDNAAREHFGEFAALNFPDRNEPTPVEQWETATGEDSVTVRGSGFSVTVNKSQRRPGYQSPIFKSVQDAVNHRDSWFQAVEHHPELLGKRWSWKTLPVEVKKKLTPPQTSRSKIDVTYCGADDILKSAQN